MKLYSLTLIFFSAIVLLSCKNEKQQNQTEYITINGSNAPILNIELTTRPTDEDTQDYVIVQPDTEVSLSYSGIEKENVTWTSDGNPIGTSSSLSTTHKWAESGLKEIKAILSNGEERTVYVMVSEVSPVISEENLSESPQSDPSVTPTSQPKTDSDNDGISDDLDLCPTQKGDKTNHGCPWPDRDGDGVPDYKDKCPDESGESRYQGCNPAPSDRDGDGINDSTDKCPDTPGSLEYDGCPPPPKDTDGDGIIDNEDACPHEKGTAQYNGCPPPKVADRDGDGVPDTIDKCPEVKGDPNYEGCPDSDGDGIPDHKDKCPNERGTQDNQGCKPWNPISNSMIARVKSLAAIDTEPNHIKSGVMNIKPSRDVVLYEAKLASSGDGKIEFSLEGGSLKEIEFVKNCNEGQTTIRFNDTKYAILKAGQTYTLAYRAIGDITFTQIENAFVSGASDSNLSLNGKIIFYDVIYKY